ncbi:cytochrome ubiquinol oxidase subunit I, partial [Klebsiella pneumoniae]|nr:cytochrome ubiquinol oxidase subunit I [Klebsiella pneumoniae]
AENSFMQNPVGFMINTKTGRAQMTSFAAVVKNEQLWYELPHVLFGAFVTGSFVVAGMAAFALLKKKNVTFFRKSIKVSLIVGLV